MSARPIVTLLTDFGQSDGYVAAIKGVILSICPDVNIVDISHDVPRQDVRYGAFVLASAYGYFPESTVHICVVDPGVGGARRAVAVEAHRQRFVAPDNGLLTPVLSSGSSFAVELDRTAFWRTPDPSTTFHGRDIFAPVGAHLARGVDLVHVGSPIDDLRMLDEKPPSRLKDGTFIGSVVHIDHFGNAISNIPSQWLDPGADWVCEVRGLEADISWGSYAAVARGAPLALLASHGCLEIAVREGSARHLLGTAVGDAVCVRRKDQAHQ